jgi:acyl dehydratase
MNLDALREHRFPAQRMSYTDKDVILYALSVGAGGDPLSETELRLTYENNLSALPTLAAVLGHPGAWIANPKFGVDFLKLLHGEQSLEVHRPLPPEADVEATYRVVAVTDKGEGKGALVFFEKRLTDAASGEALCTATSTLFLRGDGGCGSFGTPPAPLAAEPEQPFEVIDELKTGVSWALLYRLNGDRNPIHVDPAAGSKAGFERPILHGLCTYGVAGYLLVRSVCGHSPARLRSLDVRFSSPVFPGETIRVEGRECAGGVHFRAVVPERNKVVLSQGFARIEPAP